MNNESIKRQIECEKNHILTLKKYVDRYKKDISDLREKKSRESEGFNKRIKIASTTLLKANIRDSKKRAIEIIELQIKRKKRDIEYKKTYIIISPFMSKFWIE